MKEIVGRTCFLDAKKGQREESFNCVHEHLRFMWTISAFMATNCLCLLPVVHVLHLLYTGLPACSVLCRAINILQSYRCKCKCSSGTAIFDQLFMQVLIELEFWLLRTLALVRVCSFPFQTVFDISIIRCRSVATHH